MKFLPLILAAILVIVALAMLKLMPAFAAF